MRTASFVVYQSLPSFIPGTTSSRRSRRQKLGVIPLISEASETEINRRLTSRSQARSASFEDTKGSLIVKVNKLRL